MSDDILIPEFEVEAEAEPSSDPAWREALKRWPDSGFTWGSVIPHDWFYRAFDIPPITDTMRVKQAKQIRFRFLSQFEPFRQALLETCQMDLASVHGYGYEIVTPAEASRRAHQEQMAKVRKDLHVLDLRLRHVPLEQLTDEQRRENADLQARAANLKLMFRARKRVMFPAEGSN